MQTQLSAKTLRIIERAKACAFFIEVGKPISDGVATVDTWDDAIESFRNNDWDNLTETASYHMVTRALGDPDWNTKISKIKDMIDPIAIGLVDSEPLIGLPSESRRRIVDEARSQLLHACVEQETSSLHRFGLLREICEWLFDGHFACGWDGHYPQGRLIVF